METITNSGTNETIEKIENKIKEIKKIFGDKIIWYTNNEQVHAYRGRVAMNNMWYNFSISIENGIDEKFDFFYTYMTVEKWSKIMAIE